MSQEFSQHPIVSNLVHVVLYDDANPSLVTLNVDAEIYKDLSETVGYIGSVIRALECDDQVYFFDYKYQKIQLTFGPLGTSWKIIGPTVKLYYVNDYEWWAAESVEQLKAHLINDIGYEKDDLEDLEEETKTIAYIDEEGNKNSFLEQLSIDLKNGFKPPFLFAASDY